MKIEKVQRKNAPEKYKENDKSLEERRKQIGWGIIRKIMYGRMTRKMTEERKMGRSKIVYLFAN